MNTGTRAVNDYSPIIPNDSRYIWMPITSPSTQGQWTKGTEDNEWLQAAYGSDKQTLDASDIEVRLQRLERGQKISRAGRVVVTVPQFKSQTFISQTSANNPFTANTISGITYPPGQVPTQVRPSINNSEIRYPRDVTNL